MFRYKTLLALLVDTSVLFSINNQEENAYWYHRIKIFTNFISYKLLFLFKIRIGKTDLTTYQNDRSE